MDSNAPEELDSRAEFRKPSNDSTNRKYRRRSPAGESSSSSDGSPERKHSLIEDLSRVTSNVADDRQRKDNGRNQSDRRGESYKHTDRKSSWNYHRQDDHNRRDRNADEYDQGYSKSSYRSGRDTRDDLNYPGGDKEHLRDYSRSRSDAVGHLSKDRDSVGHLSKDRDSYNRAGSGRRLYNMEERNKNGNRDRYREDRGERYGNTDQKKNYRDNGSDHTPAHGPEVSRNQQNDSSRRENSDHQKKEGSWRDAKELVSERYGNEEKRRHDDCTTYKEHDSRGLKQSSDAMPVGGKDSVAKKSKFSPLESTGPGTTGASDQAYVTDSDIDAAKIAAMKAAELVNKNLVGTGYMSADQKKKLLWGNKKGTATEESANRWDTPTFGDHERQEKFNKLMGVKGDAKVELKSDNPDVEKQREQLQMELEKQYTAGLRRRDGRTVGLGL